MKGSRHHHHYHFIERILSGAIVKEESDVRIRPAVTPEVLLESFQLPDISSASAQEFGNTNLADESAIVSSLPSSLHSLHEENDIHPSGINSHQNIAKESGDIADGSTDEPKTSTGSETVEEKTANQQEDVRDDDHHYAVVGRSRKGLISNGTLIAGYLKPAKDRRQMPPENAPQISVSAEDIQGGDIPETWRVSRTSQKSSEPVVTINIGRIEVRAVTAPPQKSPTKTQEFRPLSLKEYLTRRAEGRM